MVSPVRNLLEKSVRSLVVLGLFSMGVLFMAPPAKADTNGYLLITLEKLTYSNSGPQSRQSKDEKQSYKIKVDPVFLAQFKNPPTSHSSGTQFYCSTGDGDSPAAPGMIYTQWFAPTPDGQLVTWFWAEGSEKVDQNFISAHNPVAQTRITFQGWPAVNTDEMLSFVNNYDGINLGIKISFVPAGDPALKTALSAPVTSADGSVLEKGDPQSQLQLKASCAFQEN